MVPIYRIRPSLEVEEVVQNLKIPNSICFSVDGGTMYYTDSLSFPSSIRSIPYSSVSKAVANSDALHMHPTEFQDTGI